MPVTLQRVDQATWEADAQVRTDLLRIYADAPAERLSQDPETFVREHLSATAHFFCCAHFNDRLLGAVAVRPDAEAWWLSHLCVRKATRRRGVGTRLLTLTGKAAHHDGHRLRMLSSQLSMADQMLLQRLGYRLTQAGDYFELDLPPKGAGQ
ncbi:acetyl-CoA sensor PanZ family protein [Halomonas elongata]|uniref:acetyl-CoA sensor PanZ family protein n=1 Tax=Halomonas elongata TaxID=2746 RepID=UPI000DCC9AEE|nr:acetyl-CoA sensor PanZ family protein [Halomonas elongata]MBW5801904.1 PanM family protein [Halomonas elongata]RAW06921.1 GNAT family N-acetyltransferase [Halomonas elongata]WVI71270.1 acetyl-CoA sensor PanZ family protein [Halomonas elongata]